MTGSAHDHLLAVEAGDDAQRAVGRGVLRPDVEGHALGLELDVDAGVGGLCRDVGQLLAIADDGHDVAPASGSASSSSSPAGMGSTSTMPGHGFTMRASSGKSLRSGYPSKSPGR